MSWVAGDNHERIARINMPWQRHLGCRLKRPGRPIISDDHRRRNIPTTSIINGIQVAFPQQIPRGDLLAQASVLSPAVTRSPRRGCCHPQRPARPSAGAVTRSDPLTRAPALPTKGRGGNVRNSWRTLPPRGPSFDHRSGLHEDRTRPPAHKASVRYRHDAHTAHSLLRTPRSYDSLGATCSSASPRRTSPLATGSTAPNFFLFVTTTGVMVS